MSAAMTVIAQETRTLANWRDEHEQPVQVVILLTSDRAAYVPFTFLCQTIGIVNPQAARQRVSEHAVLARMLIRLPVETPGGRQLTWCLERRALGFWLGSINANRLRPDVRPRLLEFQEQLVDIADRLLNGEVEATPAQALAEIHRIKGEQADALAWVFSLERRIGTLEHVVLRPAVDGDGGGDR